MKKILAFCLSLVLLATCAPTAFAMDECAGTGESEVTAHIYSSYSITIPEYIDLEGDIDAQAEIRIVNANIETGYKVDVYATNVDENGAITLTDIHDTTLTAKCVLRNLEEGAIASDEMPIISFYDTEVIKDGSKTEYFGINMVSHGGAGLYSGTITYRFECLPYQ